MEESFVSRIHDYAMSQPRSIPFRPATENDLAKAEVDLGFSIPNLLKSVYLQVGNGGFGPGRGGSIIGLEGGYASDFGTLVKTYEQLRGDQALQGKEWKAALLPFCEWGCNMFSCVDCADTHHPIFLFEEGDVSSKDYSIEYFFKMWIEDVDILSYNTAERETAEVVNPFTGRKINVSKRSKK